jgi:hypothetical protein
MRFGLIIAGGVLAGVGVATTEVPFIGFPLCALGAAMIGAGLVPNPHEKQTPHHANTPPTPEGDVPTPAAPGAYGIESSDSLNVDASQKVRRARAA